MSTKNGSTYSQVIALAQGQNTLTVSALDNLGNATTETISVVYDIAPPSFSYNLDHPAGAWTKTNGFTVSQFVDNPGGCGASTLDYCLLGTDGKPLVSWSPIDADKDNALTIEGKNQLEIRGTDKLGNAKTGDLIPVWIDSTPPGLILSPQLSEYTSDADIANYGWNQVNTLSATASDQYSGVSGLEWRDHGTDTWNPILTASLPGGAISLSEGSHILDIHAFDVAGNEILESYVFKVDTVAPTLSFTINGAAPPPSGMAYINTSSALSQLAMGDATSGLATLSCVTNGGSSSVLFKATSGASTPTTSASTAFPLLVGENSYVFTLTDIAGNVTTQSLHLLFDSSAIKTDDVGFSLRDLNAAETGNATVTSSGAVGRFSDLTLTVKSQGSGEAQPQSYTWALDGADKGGGVFTTPASGSPYASVLLPGEVALADGVHTVSVTVTDQCGNATASSYTFTVDRTPPQIAKSWVKIVGDESSSTSFTVAPAEPNIRVYQTDSSYADSGAGATKIWDGKAVDGVNGGFSLNGGAAEIYLVAVDPSGNKATAAYTLVRPDAPAAPGLEKVVDTSTYRSFSIQVGNPASAPTIDGVSYALAYKGVGVTSAAGGQTVAGAMVETATDDPLRWESTALGSSGAKACDAGTLGYLKAWAELTPAGVTDTIIALKSVGTATVYDIPDSPPHFQDDGTWPSYLGTNPATTYPVALDPDGQSVWYRFKVVVGSTIWLSDEKEGTPPIVDWTSHLSGGGTISLQAWAGEGDHWASDSAEVSHVYDLSHIDFTAPRVVSIGSPWASQAQWSRAATFSLHVSDTGTSGLGKVIVDLTPCNEDGSLDEGRSDVPSKDISGDFTAGAMDKAWDAIAIPQDLSGLYRLTLTVTDQAGNGTTVSSNFARFDHAIPQLSAADMAGTKDGSGQYFADAAGALSLSISAGDSGSGLAGWGYQAQGGNWVWSPWFGAKALSTASVSFTPNWTFGTSLALRFAVRDAVGNTSLASDWVKAYYDSNPPDFNFSVSGLAGTGMNYVSSLASLSPSVSPSGLAAKWSLVEEKADGSETVSTERDSWASIVQDASLWVDGGRYRIRAKVTSPNGVEGLRESPSFVLDRTPPAAIELQLLAPADRSRTAYYQNEPFIANWSGGTDAESGVSRVLRLYQIVNGTRMDLNSVNLGTGEGQARITWGPKDIAWSNGGFYIEGVSTNGAGAAVTSPAVAVSVSGAGLSVYVPAYSAGTGNLALSWDAGAISGVKDYRYQLYLQNAVDTALGGEAETAADSVLIDLTSYGLADGSKLYAVVKAYGETGTMLGQGASTVSVVDGNSPTVAWSLVPQAVTSGRVWARFTATGSSSGLASARWLVEKKAEGGDWTVIPYDANGNWRSIAVASGAEVSADLSGSLSSGDFVRLTVIVENAVGRASQVSTGALVVDNTAPPAPVVLDQGSVVNYTKQSLNFNWNMSQRDPESGLDSYYYGWFYKGEASSPATWTKLAGDSLEATVDLESMSGIDGKTVVLAVKAINGAGLASIGYSDGILMDSTAPLISRIEAYYPDASGMRLAGYVSSAAITGRSIYLAIQASDAQSWVNGGSLQAYRWNESSTSWEAVGTAVTIQGSEAVFTLPGSISGFTGGSRWRFEGQVQDAGGNVSAKAISDGFLVEGSVPSVANLRSSIDTRQVSLSWDLNSAGDSRWVGYYTVLAQWGDQTKTLVTSCRSASFVWGEGGLGLKTGDTVQFSVRAYSYTGTHVDSGSSADYQTSITIDKAPPLFDGSTTLIPAAERATKWYDRITGHLEYTAGRGVSSIQWSAVLVPGELPLVDWQEKRWVSQWDFDKTLSSLSTEALGAWQGRQIRLRFRAANSMGIWSEVTTRAPVSVDTTAPEVSSLGRPSLFSNERGAVTGWSLSLQDKQSGILDYMTALVPSSAVSGSNNPDSYVWPGSAESHAVSDSAPETLTNLAISVPLTADGEGSYTPLLRARNGTGHWSVSAGTPITIDRTPPSAIILWPGAPSQTLKVDGNDLVVQVCAGPSQAITATASEAITWSLSGVWFTDQNLPQSGYAATMASSLDFGANPAGLLYPLSITLVDQAGNQSVIDATLRYNRAPVVTVNTDALTVRPGVPVRIEDLVSVTDDEGDRSGDYPLSFAWDTGNVAGGQPWVGGSTLASVFGGGQDLSATYLQSSPTAQSSPYSGSLVVTDRYGKSTSVTLPMVVENSRAGTLAVDEYWSGPFEIRGLVVVPSGRTLTLDGAIVTVKAGMGTDGVMAGGVVVRSGGALVVSNASPASTSVFTSSMAGLYWKGIRVQGRLAGKGLGISDAERGLTLEGSGSIQLSDSILEDNLIGLHLLGGSLLWDGRLISDNSEYGVKEDGSGTFAVKNSGFHNNGVNYYRSGRTILSLDEINALAGNDGNQEVQ